MKRLLATITAALIALPSLFAQVPSLVNYQGRLLDSAGNPRSGTVSVDLAIHTNATLGVAVYSETLNPVPVNNGLFAFQFGSQAGFAEALASPEAWLEVSVDGSVVGPRQRLVAVPYAVKAGSADTANTADVALSIAPGPTPPAGMVLIPAGYYIQGDMNGGLNNAVPVSTVVSAFFMDAHEVSSNQWASVKTYADANGYGFTNDGLSKGAFHPVHTVNWYDCVKWCNARSQQAGKTPVYYTDAGFTQVYTNGQDTVYADWSAVGYRLPTEAEWEKAARGGLSGQRFPWGNAISQNLANYYGSTSSHAYDLGPDGYHPTYDDGTFPYTSPVGSFAPNGYGLYDMAGNVWEWCWDWYGTPYAGGADPRGPASADPRDARRLWGSRANGARCAVRLNYNLPVNAIDDYGFRAVLSPGQP